MLILEHVLPIIEVLRGPGLHSEKISSALVNKANLVHNLEVTPHMDKDSFPKLYGEPDNWQRNTQGLSGDCVQPRLTTLTLLI